MLRFASKLNIDANFFYCDENDKEDNCRALRGIERGFLLEKGQE